MLSTVCHSEPSCITLEFSRCGSADWSVLSCLGHAFEMRSAATDDYSVFVAVC